MLGARSSAKEGTVQTFATAEEAARVFEVTPQTVRAWVEQQRLRSAPRLGRKHRIYIDSIAEMSGLSVDQVIAKIRAGEAELGPETSPNKSGALIAV